MREKYKEDVKILAPHTKCFVCKGGFRDPVVSLQCFHTCEFISFSIKHQSF